MEGSCDPSTNILHDGVSTGKSPVFNFGLKSYSLHCQNCELLMWAVATVVWSVIGTWVSFTEMVEPQVSLCGNTCVYYVLDGGCTLVPPGECDRMFCAVVAMQAVPNITEATSPSYG